jgi:CheY-like chemotaxis protein
MPGRILVLDDEEVIREVLGDMIEVLGYETEFTVDGSEVLEKYKEAMDAGDPFKLVIMDLTIPGGMGGKETIKELLAIDPEAKAVVSSGYSDDPVMADFKEYGFKGVISKPYTLDEFDTVIKDVLK